MIWDKWEKDKEEKKEEKAEETKAEQTTAAAEEDQEPVAAGYEEMSKQPISSDMIVRDIILAHPQAAEILMQIGMGCISCPAALMESINDACMVHGLDGEEVVKYLNQELGLNQATA